MPEYILRDPTAVDRGCGRGGGGGDVNLGKILCTIPVRFTSTVNEMWLKVKKKKTEYISFKCGGRERRNGNSKARQDVLNRQSMKGIQINLKDSV